MPNVKTYIQYNKAIKFKILMNGLLRDSWLNFNEFFNIYFNLYTCNAWGLSWWGSPHVLNMQQYIAVPSLNKNITWNSLDRQSASYQAFKTPNNFNHGNWYNNTSELRYFNDQEYRQILLNKFKKTYYSCTLGNLVFFLNNFFNNSQDEYQKTIHFHVQVIRRYKADNSPTTSFWKITYDKNFDLNGIKNAMWIALFIQKSGDGDSIILPIPMNVEWDLEKE